MSRVLVVDDQPVVARLISQLLVDGGHETIQMTGELRQLLDPAFPVWLAVDAMVCGLQMSVPGIEILAVASTFHPHVKRLIFTRLGPYDQDVAAAAGLAHRVLHKPDDVLRVAEVVGELTR